MRKLTFEGFLKQYVAELAGVQTASVHKLADCLNENQGCQISHLRCP